MHVWDWSVPSFQATKFSRDKINDFDHSKAVSSTRRRCRITNAKTTAFSNEENLQISSALHSQTSQFIAIFLTAKTTKSETPFESVSKELIT